MSWKFVFRPENESTIDGAESMVRIAGYDFFLWNDEVWFVHSHGRSRTGIKVTDLF